jgi:hypothetical protein
MSRSVFSVYGTFALMKKAARQLIPDMCGLQIYLGIAPTE